MNPVVPGHQFHMQMMWEKAAAEFKFVLVPQKLLKQCLIELPHWVRTLKAGDLLTPEFCACATSEKDVRKVLEGISRKFRNFSSKKEVTLKTSDFGLFRTFLFED